MDSATCGRHVVAACACYNSAPLNSHIFLSLAPLLHVQHAASWVSACQWTRQGSHVQHAASRVSACQWTRQGSHVQHAASRVSACQWTRQGSHVQHAASRVSACQWTRQGSHVQHAASRVSACQWTRQGSHVQHAASRMSVCQWTRQGSHSLLSASDPAALLQQSHLVCSRHCQHLVLTALVHPRGLSFSSRCLDTTEEALGVFLPVGVGGGILHKMGCGEGCSVVKSGQSCCMCTLSEHRVTHTSYSPWHATA